MVRGRPIVVLGASGFLGPHLVAAAVRAGERVVAASRRPERAPHIEGIAPDELRAWEALEPGASERLLDEVRPRALILCTACSRVDECERDPTRAFALNAELPGTIAALARARGLRLVFLSTDLVFGARPPRAERYAEGDPPAPVHAYGRSKAAGEERVLRADPGALVVRLPLLYGDSGGRGLGATDQILGALERGERPALFTDEFRTPLDARSAARALLELVEREERGLLHVAGPERLSRLDLGLALLAARGLAPEEARARLRPSSRAELGLAELRPRDVSLDARVARTRLATPLRAPSEALRADVP